MKILREKRVAMECESLEACAFSQAGVLHFGLSCYNQSLVKSKLRDLKNRVKAMPESEFELGKNLALQSVEEVKKDRAVIVNIECCQACSKWKATNQKKA